MALDPNKWEPLHTEPIIPGAPVRIPPPPTSDKNPYLRTTIPADQQLQPDMVRQQYTGAVPQIRVMPLQPSARPGVNAAAQGIATTVAKQVVAATPPVVVSGGTDTDIIAGVNREGFGAIDSFYTQSNSSGSVPSPVVRRNQSPLTDT